MKQRKEDREDEGEARGKDEEEGEEEERKGGGGRAEGGGRKGERRRKKKGDRGREGRQREEGGGGLRLRKQEEGEGRKRRQLWKELSGRPKASPMAAMLASRQLLYLAVSIICTGAGFVGLSVCGPSPSCLGTLGKSPVPSSRTVFAEGQESQCWGDDKCQDRGWGESSSEGPSLLSREQKLLVLCLRASTWLPRLGDRAKEGQPAASDSSPAHP